MSMLSGVKFILLKFSKNSVTVHLSLVILVNVDDSQVYDGFCA